MNARRASSTSLHLRVSPGELVGKVRLSSGISTVQTLRFPVVNECLDPKLNDCDKLARCIDTLDSYTCECPPMSKDISPNPAFPGRVCLVFENECETGKHDCDHNAMCHDNEQVGTLTDVPFQPYVQSFTCECKQGFTDRSPNKLTRSGRVCVEVTVFMRADRCHRTPFQLVDECRTGRHTCSPQAECRDLEEGYTCECKEGYVDRSPNLLTQPGRVCGTPEVCPSNHECSSAAVCEPLGGNKYKCTCIQGYMDQSPQGTEGRICVRSKSFPNFSCRLWQRSRFEQEKATYFCFRQRLSRSKTQHLLTECHLLRRAKGLSLRMHPGIR